MSHEVTAALDRAARLGPFFRLPAGDAPVGDAYGWHPALSSTAAAIDDYQRRLGDCERRVAASTFFLGYAARLLSPAIATIALDDVVPDLTPGNVLWRQAPLELRLRAARSAQTGNTAVAQLGATAIDRHLIPLAQAVRHEQSLSERILLGNIASAAMGALTMLGAAAPPRLGPALLELPPLRGTGRYAGGGFVRNSCCLYYRVPGGGLCGDCVLTRP